MRSKYVILQMTQHLLFVVKVFQKLEGQKLGQKLEENSDLAIKWFQG